MYSHIFIQISKIHRRPSRRAAIHRRNDFVIGLRFVRRILQFRRQMQFLDDKLLATQLERQVMRFRTAGGQSV